MGMTSVGRVTWKSISSSETETPQARSTEVNDTLLHKLSAFPGDPHVREVCERGGGEARCRYLTVVYGGAFRNNCEKYGELRNTIDQRVAENSMRRKGDNCEGLVGVLKHELGSLVGTPVEYTESHPTLTLSGTLKEIDIIPSVATSYGKDTIETRSAYSLMMKVDWEDGRDYSPGYYLHDLQIDVTTSGLSFSNRGAGTLAGAIKVRL
jgi:hypothetical protein